MYSANVDAHQSFSRKVACVAICHEQFPLGVSGQVGTNTVKLEHKASKVFRPKAADFAEVSRRVHHSSDLFFASSSLGPLFQPLQ